MSWRPRCFTFFFSLLIVTVSLAQVSKKPIPKPNVILITLDTTRADRMGFLGSRRGLTPNLDALAKTAAVFSRAYAPVPLTTPSHATILTGTYPQYNQVDELGKPLEESVPYLPDLLHRQGYRTGAFVGSLVLDPGGQMAIGFNRGFDVYDAGFHPKQRGENRYASVERRASEVVSRAQAWLKKTPKTTPFFLWVHFYDAHDPYDAPEPYKSKFSDPYDAEIAYTDAMLGQLFTSLRTAGLYDSSLIAIMADHGEAFGEHDERSHGMLLYDSTIHVPLVIKLSRDPGSALRAPVTVDGRVSLADVTPTILQFAGLPVPKEIQGESLLPLIRPGKNSPSTSDRAIYSETNYPFDCFGWSVLRALRTGKYLYVEAPRRELYNLVSDPKAEKSVAESSPAIVDTLQGQLDAFRKSTSAKLSPDKGKLDPAANAKLNALGYATGGETQERSQGRIGGIDPKDRITTANLLHDALLDVDSDEFQAAIPKLERVLETEPNSPLAHGQLGTAWTRLKNYEKALPILKRAIELNPYSGLTHYELGLALFDRGEYPESAVQFELAIKFFPRWTDAHFSLAAVYTHIERIPDAIEEFGKTIQLNPENYRAHLLRGWFLTNEEKPAEALPDLRKAIELRPDSVEAHQYMAGAYEKMGDDVKAAEEWNRAAALDAQH